MLHDKYAYLSTSDIKEIYRMVKGSEEGMASFVKEAKQIGSRTKRNAYVYKDEERLYDIFEKHIGEELARRGIDCFGRLMQFVS